MKTATSGKQNEAIGQGIAGHETMKVLQEIAWQQKALAAVQSTN